MGGRREEGCGVGFFNHPRPTHEHLEMIVERVENGSGACPESHEASSGRKRRTVRALGTCGDGQAVQLLPGCSAAAGGNPRFPPCLPQLGEGCNL